MEVITLSQVKYGTFNGKVNTMVIHVKLPEPGKGRDHWADVEKSTTELKQAVVNRYLQEGYRAPQNEIAKYITQDGYYKKVKTGQHKFEGLYVTTEYDYDEEFVPGPKLVMTRGR